MDDKSYLLAVTVPRNEHIFSAVSNHLAEVFEIEPISPEPLARLEDASCFTLSVKERSGIVGYNKGHFEWHENNGGVHYAIDLRTCGWDEMENMIARAEEALEGRPPVIHIDRQRVRFHDDHIKIGCVSVSHAKIEKIHNYITRDNEEST